MNKYKISKLYYLIVSLLVIAAILNILYMFIRSSKESEGISSSLPADYKALFRAQYRNRLDSAITFNSKVRKPVSEVIFDHKYLIVVTKIPQASSITGHPLKNITKLEPHSNKNAYNTIYNDIGQRCLDLKCRSGEVASVKDLILGFKGEITNKDLSSDSLNLYSLKFEHFSIRYGYNDNADFYGNSIKNELFKLGQSEVTTAFIKKRGFIYIILLSSSDCNLSVNGATLKSLIEM